MSVQHIVKSWARKTGNTVEEEEERYKMRGKRKNESLFKIRSYEQYLDRKAQNKLRGKI